MNHQMTPRGNRPRGLTTKHILQIAVFAAFSLWLLYQITQPNSNSGTPGSRVSNDRVSNFMGRKGSAGIPKSTTITLSSLTLQDATNPGEEGEIATRYSKGIEEVEFRTKTGSLKVGNDDNTLVSGHDGSLTVKKSNISFPDENGIPQHVRDKLVGIESVIAKGVRNEKNVTSQES